MREHIKDVGAHPSRLHPVIEEFKNLIENDPVVFMLFTRMFEEIPKGPRFRKDPTGAPQIRSHKHTLLLINAVMITAPEFNATGRASPSTPSWTGPWARGAGWPPSSTARSTPS